jgi:hypothetical protein
MRRLEMITEAMVGIAIMESPMQLEMRLRSFLEATKEAAEGDAAAAGASDENELRAAG